MCKDQFASGVLYFVWKLFSYSFMLALLFVGFAVGNCGLGGIALVLISAFILGVFFFWLRFATFGYQTSDQNGYIQGALVFVLGVMAFCSVLTYVWCSNNGYDPVTFTEGWRYWRSNLLWPGVIIGTVSALCSLVRTCIWAHDEY